MSSELSTCQSVMLNPYANVEVGEPKRLKDSDTWTVDIKANGWPHGSNYTTYFGTEAQVRAIAGGHQAMEATDPDQLDVLVVDDAKPEPRPMTDIGAQVFELGVALNRIGTVASW